MSAESNGGAGVAVRLSLEAMLGKLSDTVENVNGTLKALHKFMTPNPRQSPIVRPFAGAVVSDGSTYITISLGGPTSGRVWDVRRVAVWKGGGVDQFATVSGVNVIAVVMVPPNKGSAAIPSFIDLAFGPGQVPNDGEFSSHQFTIRFPQVLALVLKGTANNDNYMATGQAEEYVESTAEGVNA